MSEKYYRPTVLDLFSGAGGMSLGFEQAGFTVVGAVENDPIHAAVHRYNFPKSQVLCEDVSSLSVHDLKGFRDVDVVIGGPPCQGFSLIGKRFIADNRNKLVFEFLRIVKMVRPRYFVMENVPGMKAGGHHGILEKLIKEFEKIDYQIPEPQVLNAADYGVPQKRKRLFLLGARKGESVPECPQVLFAKDERVAVKEAISDLPEVDNYLALLDSDHCSAASAAYVKNVKRASEYAKILRGVSKEKDDYSFPRKFTAGLFNSQRTIHTEEVRARFGSTAQDGFEPTSRYHRLAVNGLSNTIRAGTGPELGSFTSPRPIHPTRRRVITVREAARLHSYPDWFRFHATKWHGFREVGNSVPPRLARAMAREVIRALALKPLKPRTNITLDSNDLLKMGASDARQYHLQTS